MIIVMDERATERNIEDVAAAIEEAGCGVHRSTGTTRTILGALGQVTEAAFARVSALDGVKDCLRIGSPYKLSSRQYRPGGTIVEVGSVAIGSGSAVIAAGPCSVENVDQIERIAAAVADAGVRIIRGGAFKPRSSPYAFQGMGEAALRLLRLAADRHGLAVVTEVMDPSQVPLVAEYADLLQVGARNMQNFGLLRALGRQPKPVLLKRGLAATLEELLLSAEYILAAGNEQVVLCERGIRTFELYTRNTMDVSAIPALKTLSHLPVIGDPSHGTGRRDLVLPMARAAVAAGADGILLEVHHDPDRAWTDGAQSLDLRQFAELVRQLRIVQRAVAECHAGDVALACQPAVPA